MIVRINGREEPQKDLQARLSEAMLRLGREVRLGEALLCLGGLESLETLARVRLGVGTFAQAELHA